MSELKEPPDYGRSFSSYVGAIYRGARIWYDSLKRKRHLVNELDSLEIIRQENEPPVGCVDCDYEER